MAANYLITGYWGEPHVTAENDRGINAAIFGAGRFVLPVGEQFKAEYIGNNTVRIYDGKLIDNGAFAGIPAGEYVDLLIPEAGQGMNRNDLIVFQYSQDGSTLIESGVFMVLSGTETSGEATDPELSQQDILTNEATLDQMALWRVPVSSTVISDPVQLFDVHGLTNVDNTPDFEKYVAYAQRAGTADKAKYGLTIRFNGGRTTNTDMWEYDGSTSRTVNITPEKIGAVPNDHCKVASLDEVTAPGWYRKYFTAEEMPDGAVYGNWDFCVSTFNDSNTFEIVMAVNNDYVDYTKAVHIRRKKENGVWLDWEWENPFLDIDIEYRTTERFLGKPVYVKSVRIESIAANSGESRGISYGATRVLRAYASGKPTTPNTPYVTAPVNNDTEGFYCWGYMNDDIALVHAKSICAMSDVVCTVYYTK